MTRGACVLDMRFFAGEAPPPARVRLSHERDAYRWMDPEEARGLLDPLILARGVVELDGLLRDAPVSD